MSLDGAEEVTARRERVSEVYRRGSAKNEIERSLAPEREEKKDIEISRSLRNAETLERSR
jgi:hypothetical protein